MSDSYASRINRVIDYIQANLEQPLTLEELAREAAFSPYHFHRIFRAMMGETLNRFVARVRVEHAATRLLADANKPITDIALECGFSSSTSFAHAFSRRFGISAREFRTEHCGGRTNSKLEQLKSKSRQAVKGLSGYVDSRTNNTSWRITMTTKKQDKLDASVEVKEMPSRTVAYIRHVGPYKGDSELFGRLIGQLTTWAGARGLLGPNMELFTRYEDNPEITEEEKLRMSVCLTIPDDTTVDGEIAKTQIAGGKYAVAHFDGLLPSEYADAWQAVYGGWLPESGFQPSEEPPLEFYLSDPGSDPEGRSTVEIAVPVKPA